MHRDPWTVAGHLARAGDHKGSLTRSRLTAVLLEATIEGGSLLAGAWRAEVSAVDQVAGVGRATGGAWVTLVAPKGAGGDVSKVALGHVDRRCEFSTVTVR